MDGTVSGLDVGACLALPSLARLDPEVIEDLLAAVEHGAMTGMAKAAKDRD